MVKRSSGFRIAREIRLQSGAKPIPGYELSRLRGKGGCGEVWAATGPAGPVALKFMKCKQSRMAGQEVRTLMGLRDLDHPHLIRYQQIWCHDGYIILSMELADISLAEFLELYQGDLKSPIALDQLCVLLTDAARGIDYLNARHTLGGGSGKGIQHCDIKPSNLLLCGDRVKVADFGLANRLVSTQETRPSGGTLEYCAPEVFLGRVSGATDQFALAVSYCQLRTGKLPFNDTPTSLTGRCTRQFPDLSSLSCKEQVVVARALHPIPAKRWTTCCEFMGQLTRAVHAS
jgi:serine/threonine-protein kinase